LIKPFKTKSSQEIKLRPRISRIFSGLAKKIDSNTLNKQCLSNDCEFSKSSSSTDIENNSESNFKISSESKSCPDILKRKYEFDSSLKKESELNLKRKLLPSYDSKAAKNNSTLNLKDKELLRNLMGQDTSIKALDDLEDHTIKETNFKKISVSIVNVLSKREHYIHFNLISIFHFYFILNSIITERPHF
jgi:hypothetical protein